jgi:integrase
METAPPPDTLPALTADAVARNLERHAEINADSHAANTKRALEGDTRLFQAWCRKHGQCALPAAPRAVGDFVAAMAAGEAVEVAGRDRHGWPRTVVLGGVRRPATIGRYLASIAHLHRAAGLAFDRAHPEITQRLRGARRRLGVRQRQAHGLCWDEILRMLPGDLPDRPPYEPLWQRLRPDERGALKAAARLAWLSALRDRALLLVAYETLCRRAELVALRVEHLHRGPDGVTVFVERAKNDPEGEGRHRPLRRRTVAAVDAWLAAVDWSARERLRQDGRSRAAVEAAPSVVASGPLFRSIHRAGRVRDAALPASRVPVILKRLGAAAGLDPEAVAGLSGHSTRVGAGAAHARHSAPAGTLRLRTDSQACSLFASFRQPVADGTLVRCRLAPARRHAIHVGQLMGNAFVAVDAGALPAEQVPLVDTGRACSLLCDVHGLRRVAVPAFQRIVGLEPRPLVLGQLTPHGNELVARVDGAEELAPDFLGCLHLAGDLVRPLVGDVAIGTGRPHARAVREVDRRL